MNVSGVEELDHVSFSEAGGNVVGLPAGFASPNGVALVFSSVSDNTVTGTRSSWA